MTADHGKAGDGLQRAGEDGAWPAGEYEKVGAGMSALAEKLQADGAAVFVRSWSVLLQAMKPTGATLGRRKP